MNEYSYDDEALDAFYEDNRRRSYFRITLGLIAYITISNVLVYAFSNFVGDPAIIMILSSLVALLAASRIIPNQGFKELISYRKEDSRLKKIIIFISYMYLFSTIFGLFSKYFVKFLHDTFNFKNFDVSEFIVGSMNAPMFIYAILLGPFFEEYLFRGLIAQNLAKYSKLAALIFSTLMFAPFHMNMEQSISVLGVGFIVSYVGINYSWKSSFLLHVINNIYATGILHIMINYGEDSPLITIMGLFIIALIVIAIVHFIKIGRKNLKNKLMEDPLSRENFRKFFSYPPTIIVILVMVILLIFSSNVDI